MKNRWRSIFAMIIGGLLLVITNVPSDAARRVARGSSYDGTWSVAIYTLRGDCGSIRAALRIVGGRVYSDDPIKPTALSAPGALSADPRQRQPVGVGLRPAVV